MPDLPVDPPPLGGDVGGLLHAVRHGPVGHQGVEGEEEDEVRGNWCAGGKKEKEEYS